MENHVRTVKGERMGSKVMDKSVPPRNGDDVYFEVDDQLHEGGIRLVHAKIIRRYPKRRGNCCEYLAFDCIDLDRENIYYTVPYDEEIIRTNTRKS